MVNVGIRASITMKFGQASYHRQSNDPTKGVCGVALKHIRLIRPTDFYRRCPRCFDKHLGKHVKELFGLEPTQKAVS